MRPVLGRVEIIGALPRRASRRDASRYGVDVEGFEALALPTLDDADDEINALDEIGRMELKSAAFAARVEALLKRGARLVGALTAPIYGHRVPFCDRVAATPGVRVVKITGKTRDAATAELRADVVARWATGGPAKKRRRKV